MLALPATAMRGGVFMALPDYHCPIRRIGGGTIRPWLDKHGEAVCGDADGCGTGGRTIECGIEGAGAADGNCVRQIDGGPRSGLVREFFGEGRGVYVGRSWHARSVSGGR